HLQKGTTRNVVAIEDRQQFTLALGESMIEVAGFGVAVVGPNEVFHSDLGGEVAQGLAFAVVEDVNAELVARPIQAHGGEHGGAHHAQVFVVSGNVNVNGRPVGGVRGQRRRIP